MSTNFSLVLVVLFIQLVASKDEGFNHFTFHYEPHGAHHGSMSAQQSEEALAVANESDLHTSQSKVCKHKVYTNLQAHAHSKHSIPNIPTIVDVKLIIMALNGISDVTGVVTVTAELALRWFDPRLDVSDSSDTCQFDTLQVPVSDIWFPYFLIQNGADVSKLKIC